MEDARDLFGRMSTAVQKIVKREKSPKAIVGAQRNTHSQQHPQHHSSSSRRSLPPSSSHSDGRCAAAASAASRSLPCSSSWLPVLPLRTSPPARRCLCPRQCRLRVRTLLLSAPSPQPRPTARRSSPAAQTSALASSSSKPRHRPQTPARRSPSLPAAFSTPLRSPSPTSRPTSSRSSPSFTETRAKAPRYTESRTPGRPKSLLQRTQHSNVHADPHAPSCALADPCGVSLCGGVCCVCCAQDGRLVG